MPTVERVPVFDFEAMRAYLRSIESEYHKKAPFKFNGTVEQIHVKCIGVTQE